MAKARIKVHVEGVVQGVFYRHGTRQKAKELGVNGWVRNMPDGSVECLVEGDQESVEALISWCQHGPLGARVDRVTTSSEEYKGDLEGFSIGY
jgi:acylphosphatase